MKRVLLISALLAFMASPPSANAMTVENVVITETGGYSSERVRAEGDTDASASVESHIRTEGSNTRVRVDVRTAEDGVTRATSTERTLERGGKLEVRIEEEVKGVRASNTVAYSASSSPSRLFQAFDQFKISLERLFRLMFFFW